MKSAVMEGLLLVPRLLVGIFICIIDKDVREMVRDELREG